MSICPSLPCLCICLFQYPSAASNSDLQSSARARNTSVVALPVAQFTRALITTFPGHPNRVSVSPLLTCEWPHFRPRCGAAYLSRQNCPGFHAPLAMRWPPPSPQMAADSGPPPNPLQIRVNTRFERVVDAAGAALQTTLDRHSLSYIVIAGERFYRTRVASADSSARREF